MELVLDIVIDAAKDTLALVPFLFVTFALLAVFEFAAGDKIRSAIQRAGALDGRADLVSRRELEDREQGEGDEQERHERQRVLGGVDHDIQNKFHGGTTFLSKDGCEGFLPMKQAVNLP